MKKILLLSAASALLLVAGCKREKTGTLHLDFSHEVDGQALVQDDVRYETAAGYPYSVTTLTYYVANVKLLGDGIDDYASTSIQLLDIDDPASLVISLPEVPFGDYKGITFTLGVDNARNVTGGLPTSVENSNMAWPDMMGGGYHHMKFEGMWENNGSPSGFMMHLGLNGNQANCDQNQAISFSEDNQRHTLTMNLNEWFRNPAVYDFATDGTMIMSNEPSMQKLARNGDDVFDN